MKNKIKLITIALVPFILVGCTLDNNLDNNIDNSRFKRIDSYYSSYYKYTGSRLADIVYDKETLIEYAVSYEGLFSVLYDADGKPLLYNSAENRGLEDEVDLEAIEKEQDELIEEINNRVKYDDVGKMCFYLGKGNNGYSYGYYTDKNGLWVDSGGTTDLITVMVDDNDDYYLYQNHELWLKIINNKLYYANGDYIGDEFYVTLGTNKDDGYKNVWGIRRGNPHYTYGEPAGYFDGVIQLD